MLRGLALFIVIGLIATGCSSGSSVNDTSATSVATSPTSSAVTTTSEPATTSPPEATTTVLDLTTTTTSPPSTTTTTAPEYTSRHPPGLECEDFQWWDQAVGYWLASGRPSQIRVDDRGVPCPELMPYEPIIGSEHESWNMDHGMYCRDFVALMDHPWHPTMYWLLEGQPARMDADGDGIPCETVYPERIMRDFLEDTQYETFPSGLYCRELVWYRPFFPQAVAYFYQEGFPARMDADRNGIPCETVYPDQGLDFYLPDHLPQGLSCDELEGQAGYVDVAAYWLLEGRPASLDPDGDGYPCSPGWPYPDMVEWFKDGYLNCCAG